MFHADLGSLDQHLKGPGDAHWTKVCKGYAVENVGEPSTLYLIGNEGLVLVRKAVVGHGGANDLLQKLAIKGYRIGVLVDGIHQRTQAGHSRVEQESTLTEGDVLLGEPGILVEGTDETLVGTVVAALGKGRLHGQQVKGQ